jgi:alanine racemase
VQVTSQHGDAITIAACRDSWEQMDVLNLTASTMPHRTWAEIDRSALRHNVAATREQVGERVRIMAVVKADAYGHGVRHVVPALADEVEMFGVANVTEALEVRELTSTHPVFLLGPALPEERAEVVVQRFIPAVSTVEEAAAYAALAGAEPLEIHLAVDTGMGRIGIWQDDALEVVRAIRKLDGVRVTGIGSHLPVADEDDKFTREQLERFEKLVAELRADGLVSPVIHVANSAGVIGFPAHAGDLVRPGLMLYGCAPRPEFQTRLRAAMTWKTRVLLVREVGPGRGLSYGRTFITDRDMRVAILAVGYADGYRRHLSSSGAAVLIRGRRCAVLGRVTMDQILADVTALPEVQAGEEVVLLGCQGDEEILVAELAAKAGTIPWEIFTGLGSRVVRMAG